MSEFDAKPKYDLTDHTTCCFNITKCRDASLLKKDLSRHLYCALLENVKSEFLRGSFFLHLSLQLPVVLRNLPARGFFQREKSETRDKHQSPSQSTANRKTPRSNTNINTNTSTNTNTNRKFQWGPTPRQVIVATNRQDTVRLRRGMLNNEKLIAQNRILR